MTLAEKGPLAPVPALAALLEPISKAVQSWPGIVAAAHWDLYRVGEVVDGADFYVGEEELGHIHLNGEVHLATSPALGAALVAAGLARPLRYGGAAYLGWTEVSVRSAADAERARWLLELNYRRLTGVPETALVAEVGGGKTAA